MTARLGIEKSKHEIFTISRDYFYRRGSRGGEMGEFSPPFFWAPFFHFFLIPQKLKQYLIFLTLLQKFTPHFKILDPPWDTKMSSFIFDLHTTLTQLPVDGWSVADVCTVVRPLSRKEANKMNARIPPYLQILTLTAMFHLILNCPI